MSDLEIEEWVCEQYGFVPHPFWIRDCREVYLNEKQLQPLDARHKCPPEKRLMIRDAFVHFGLLPEYGGTMVDLSNREQLEDGLRAELDEAERLLKDATPERKPEALRRFSDLLRTFTELVLTGRMPRD